MLVESGAPRPWTEGEISKARVAIESFRPHWDRINAYAHRRFVVYEDKDKTSKSQRKHVMTGTFDAESFCIWLGVTQREYEMICDYMKPSRLTSANRSETIDLYLCDRVLTGAGEPQTVNHLYVVRGRKRTGHGMKGCLVSDLVAA